MTTTYKEPRIEVEQQFTAAASNTYLPELRGCIVAPFYDIVDEEDVGTYVGAEEEYAWASVRPVDVRTGANADELTYPLTVTLKEALTEVVSGETGGGQGTTGDTFTFTDTGAPFTYPLPTDTEMFLKFDSGSYTHTIGETTLALTTQALFPYNNPSVASTVPDFETVITQAIPGPGDSVSAKIVSVHAVLGGPAIAVGAAMPAAGYVWVKDVAIGHFAAGQCAVVGGATLDATAAETYLFTLTSVPPAFYPGLDFITEAVTSALVYDSTTPTPVSAAATVVSDPSSTVLTIYSAGGMHAPGTMTSVVTDRIALTASEIALMRRVRSVSSTSTCKMYVAKTGVVYSALVYDIFERTSYDITIDEFTDWNITLTDTGVILPISMVTPDSQPITSADVYLTYRALRSDLEDELEYYTTTAELITEFGADNKYNTGEHMMYLALTNANGRPVYCTGLGSTFYTDVASAYSSALSFLEDKRVYAIACASMLPAVHTLVNAHINLCSTAELAQWRIGLNSHIMADYARLFPVLPNVVQTTDSGYVDIYREGFTGNRIVDAAGTWITDGVSAGDHVYVTGWTAVEKALISTHTAGGGKTLTVTDWGTSDTLVTLTTIADPGVSLRGKTVIIHGINDSVSIDAGVYSDHTRGGVDISTAQTYTALGYKVIASSWSSNVLTLHIYTEGTDVLVGALPATSDYIEVYDGPLSLSDETAILNQYIEIGTLVSEDMALATFKSGYTGVYTGVTYEMRDHYDRMEMATNYAAYPAAFDNRRMNFVFPHVYQDSEGTQMHGYFIAAAEAGWIGGAYAHQSVTSQNLQGFYRLLYSNKYFKKEHLNEIAGGGVTIYTQEVDNIGITCRHQLTTDMESILTQENSITRSVDTGSYMIFDALNPLKGRYNIVDDLYTVINTKIGAVRNLLCEKKYSRYGSILKKFNVTVLEQDDTAADGLYIEIDCETQKPFNRARVLIKVK